MIGIGIGGPCQLVSSIDTAISRAVQITIVRIGYGISTWCLTLLLPMVKPPRMELALILQTVVMGRLYVAGLYFRPC